MNLSELKRRLQDHITDGLVLIIGSGLSAQLGMPTMPQLADYILTRQPSGLSSRGESQWTEICAALRGGQDLESALTSLDLEPALEEYVIQVTAELICDKELVIFQQAISGALTIPLSRLLTQLMPTTSCLPVITSNYDRLIELAADLADVGLDSTFTGRLMCKFNPPLSHEALGYATLTRLRNGIKRVYRKHVKLFKPHGSVDWFNFNGTPVCCDLPIALPRLMITPGKTKYLKGYEAPFDAHRSAANEAIDRAARYLILGFGFNDQQLETHLRPQIRGGRPCVIMNKELTPKTLSVISSSPSVIALSCGLQAGSTGTLVSSMRETLFFPGLSLWNLDSFLAEVLS